jgi:hypothetical protein
VNEELKAILEEYKITLEEYILSCDISDEEFYDKFGGGK